MVRNLTRDLRARLFYYSSWQEARFSTALEGANTFLGGMGAQMELEKIRARTATAAPVAAALAADAMAPHVPRRSRGSGSHRSANGWEVFGVPVVDLGTPGAGDAEETNRGDPTLRRRPWSSPPRGGIVIHCGVFAAA